jgi:hypothetical protein
MGGSQTGSDICKYNYALLWRDVKLFLRSLACTYYMLDADLVYQRPSLQVATRSSQHNYLNTYGIITFTLQAPQVHWVFSTKSASFNKSS